MIEILRRYIVKDGKIFVKTGGSLARLDYERWKQIAEEKLKRVGRWEDDGD